MKVRNKLSASDEHGNYKVILCGLGSVTDVTDFPRWIRDVNKGIMQTDAGIKGEDGVVTHCLRYVKQEYCHEIGMYLTAVVTPNRADPNKTFINAIKEGIFFVPRKLELGSGTDKIVELITFDLIKEGST